MKKNLALFWLLISLIFVNQAFAQDDNLNPFPNDASTENQSLDPERFITEAYQIPSYNLYLQDWNTEYLKIKSLGISFGNTDDIKIILVDHNNPFVLPCANYQVSSNYGPRKNAMHTGIDLAVAQGEPVRSCFDGVVRMARDYSSYGKTVVVRHYNGLETVYAHLDSIMVRPNEKVLAGQQIGEAGNTGRSTGPHLHFETRFLYEHFDPAKMVDFTTGEVLSNVLTIAKSELDFDGAGEKNASLARPAAGNSSSATTVGNYHVVSQGDTLYAISLKYHTTLDKILKLNNLTEDAVLQLGQKIRVK